MQLLAPLRDNLRRAGALAAAVRLVRDLERLDEVFEIADALATPAMLDDMTAAVAASSARAAAALETRPRVGAIDLDALAALPEGTLGHEFAAHARRNGIDPSAFPALPGDTPGSYLRAHLYETHDIWHVVGGYDTDVPGEIALQAFYLAQFPGRLPLLLLPIALLNTGLFAFDRYRERLDALTAGWQHGNRAAPLFGIDWAAQWERPLADIRAELAV